VWPAFGIALAAVLAYGPRIWPAIFASAFVVAYQSPVFAMTAAGQAAGATLATVAGAWALRRQPGFDPRLPRLRDAVSFIIVGAFGSAVVSSSIGIVAIHATSLEGYSGLFAGWLIYWLGDATGALLVTPLVFTAGSIPGLNDLRRVVEFALLLTLVTAASFILFGGVIVFPNEFRLLAFAVLPFVMWAAVMFGVGGTTIAVALTAAIATLMTAFGFGPFAQQSAFVNAALLDVLFAVLSVSGLALAAVIAERERAETERERLIRVQAEAEARLRLAAIVESSTDAVISTTLDGTIQSWNASAKRIFGFSAAEAVGQPMTMIVPERLWHEDGQCLARLRGDQPIDPFETIRVTREGRELSVSLAVSPIRDAHGRVVAAATIIRDISDQKRVAATVSSLSRRLIHAQELERSRIARELHDDIGQRLSLLAVNLEALTSAEELPLPVDPFDLHRMASEIAGDIQSLSHRLHSPRLSLLGLPAAMKHFCGELAEQQKVTIELDCRDIPGQIPSDVSLCLFRILQEALHNAAKHSGAREFEVRLWATPPELHLSVADRGRGFDVRAARTGRGIGLASMEERIKLVDGVLSVESWPEMGTTIRARVRYIE
jgi:PAS domain S-box-containing protein